MFDGCGGRPQPHAKFWLVIKVGQSGWQDVLDWARELGVRAGGIGPRVTKRPETCFAIGDRGEDVQEIPC